jgi:hypothetical protein
MNHITYITEKRINELKKLSIFERSQYEQLVIEIWDDIFCDYGFYDATLKELEQYIGCRLNSDIQRNVRFFEGINGIEYITKGNVKYVGTNNLSCVNINDFNLFVKNLIG